jgi:hypothetical protein
MTDLVQGHNHCTRPVAPLRTPAPPPVGEVWAAITEPARLADWWLPFDADITVDLRPGGLMVMSATGAEPVTITCEILRVIQLAWPVADLVRHERSTRGR